MSESTAARRPTTWEDVSDVARNSKPGKPGKRASDEPAPPPEIDPAAWNAVTSAQDAPPNLAGALGDRFQQGSSAALQGLLGLYDVAAIPQNLLASATGLEFMRAKPIAEHLQNSGLPAAEPSMSNAVIQGGAGTLPFLLTGGAAQSGQIAGAAGPVTRRVLSSFAENKPAQVAGGVGAEMAHRAAEDATDNPVARFVAPLVGGLLGGGLMTAGQAGLRYMGGLFGDGQMDAARRYVATLGPTARRQFVSAMQNYRPETPVTPSAIDSEITRMRNLRTTAQVADDSGISDRAPFATEKIVETKRDILDGPSTDEGGFFGRRLAARDARGNVLDLLTPNADPAAIRPVIEGQAQQAGQGLQTAVTGLGPAIEPRPAGEALQDAHGTIRRDTSAEVGALRQAIDPATPVPVRSIRRAVQQAGAREFISPDSQSAEWADISPILTRLSGQPSLGFGDLQKMRSVAIEEARKAFDSGNARLGRVFDATAEAIRTGLEAGLPPEDAARFRAFQTAASERGAQMGGPASGKLDRQSYGRPDTPAETVPGLFFKSGEAGGASMREFGDLYRLPDGTLHPAAAQAIRGHVAERIATEGMDPTTHEVNAQWLAKFYRDNRYALRAVPELGLDQAVGNVRNAAVLASERGAPNVQTLPQHQRGVAQAVLGIDNIDEAVSGMVRGRNGATQIRDLMTRLQGNPNAQEGVRRAILNDWSRAGTANTPVPGTDLQTLRQSGGTKWWNDNQDVIAAAFTRDERQRLQMVHNSLFSEAKVAARMSPTNSDTASNISNAQLLASRALGEGPQTRGRALGEGLIDSMSNIPGVSGWAKRFRARADDQVMGDLYHLALDPEVFASLLRRASPQTFAELAGIAQRRSGARRGLDTTARGLATTTRAALPGVTNAVGGGYRDGDR
jgi:hypothetical protein